MGKADGKSKMGKNKNTSPKGGLLVLPVLMKEETHPCFECVHCCNYVATEIDAPTTMKDYDCIYWYLYHKDVSVFIDHEGDWYIQFTSRCDALTPEGLCGVYEDRPYICRDYKFTECEKAVPQEPAHDWEFNTAEELTDWLQRKRPRTWQKFVAYKKKQKLAQNPEELHRVKKANARAAAGSR